MALILKDGFYYRTRCCVCRKYFLHRNKRAKTCSTACRQIRCRTKPRPQSYPTEDLGRKSQGESVSGILSELLKEIDGYTQNGTPPKAWAK